MKIKKRYYKLVANDQTLKRVLSSSDAGKYPTIGRFLPPSAASQAVFQAAVTPAPVPAAKLAADQAAQADLDLLDQLVGQTILNRSNPSSPNQNQLTQDQSPQVSSRAKELQNNLPVLEVTQEQVPVAEVAPVLEVAEVAPTTETASSVEVSPNPELAELSKELQEVSKETKEQRDQAEIKQKQQEISNLAAAAATPIAVSDKPVVVLPITAKSKEEAKFKSTKYSVKWLVEWCEKIAKVFSGAVVYKEEIEDV